MSCERTASMGHIVYEAGDGLTLAWSKTPTRAHWAPAGFSMGPRRLKAVRTLSALRTGDTVLMAGWYRGANMNPTPAVSTHLATP